LSYSMVTEYSKDDIKRLENEINNFCNEKGISLKPKLDIVKECKNLGFLVVSLSLPDKIDGAILVENNQKIIGVNEKITDRKEINRVVAHELSHYIRKLKEQEESKMLFAMKDSILHNEEKDASENEMDYMSAAVLVPMDSFVGFIELFGLKNIKEFSDVKKVSKSKINYLANYYNVEEELIKRRIVEAARYVG